MICEICLKDVPGSPVFCVRCGNQCCVACIHAGWCRQCLPVDQFTDEVEAVLIRDKPSRMFDSPLSPKPMFLRREARTKAWGMK